MVLKATLSKAHLWKHTFITGIPTYISFIKFFSPNTLTTTILILVINTAQ